MAAQILAAKAEMIGMTRLLLLTLALGAGAVLTRDSKPIPEKPLSKGPAPVRAPLVVHQSRAARMNAAAIERVDPPLQLGDLTIIDAWPEIFLDAGGS
jgi:hypothetical protein